MCILLNSRLRLDLARLDLAASLAGGLGCLVDRTLLQTETAAIIVVIVLSLPVVVVLSLPVVVVFLSLLLVVVLSLRVVLLASVLSGLQPQAHRDWVHWKEGGLNHHCHAHEGDECCLHQHLEGCCEYESKSNYAFVVEIELEISVTVAGRSESNLRWFDVVEKFD